MKKIILVLLFVMLIFMIGCAKEISIEGAKEEMKPAVKTEIKVKQMGVEMIISPAKDNTLSGVVSIKASQVPEGTKGVAFAIQGPGIADIHQTGPNLGWDDDGSDGWLTEFETASYSNGDYSIGVIASSSSKLKEGEVLGGAEAKVTISNQAFAPAPAPKVAPPYKSLWALCQNNPTIIKEAKEVKANALWLSLIFDFDQKGGVVWTDPQEVPGCAALVKKAHENGLDTIFSPITPGAPPAAGTFHKEHFLQTSREMMKAYASFAEENEVSAFVIATELDTFVSNALNPTGKQITRELLHEVAKALIAETGSVYTGEIGIGLVGISNTEDDKPYYPFEGADFLCYTTGAAQEIIDKSLTANAIKLNNMQGIAQQAGFDKVMICEFQVYPEGIRSFSSTYHQELQSNFKDLKFQEAESEIYRRFIVENKEELFGFNVPWEFPPLLGPRERKAKEGIKEGLGGWE